MSNRKILFSLLFAAFLAACGGGNDGSSANITTGARDTTGSTDSNADGTGSGNNNSGTDSSGSGGTGTGSDNDGGSNTGDEAEPPQQSWTITDMTSVLPASDNGLYAIVDINENGKVLMSGTVDSKGQGIIYHNGQVDLLPVDDRHLSLIDITNDDQALGVRYYLSRAFPSNVSIFTYKNGSTTLHNEIWTADYWPSGLNNAGQFLVNPAPGSRDRRSGIWKDGTFSDLDMSGRYKVWATDLNDQGEAVGHLYSIVNIHVQRLRAFISANGNLVELGGTEAYPTSWATRINNKGQVIGGLSTREFANSYEPGDHFFLYSDGQLQDLGEGHAIDLNNNGQIVGENANGGFLYSEGELVMLSDLPEVKAAGWRITQALAINDRGQIVTWAVRNDEKRLLLLSKTG